MDKANFTRQIILINQIFHKSVDLECSWRNLWLFDQNRYGVISRLSAHRTHADQ